MKKNFKLFIIILLGLISLSSCKFFNGISTDTYRVSFNYNYDEEKIVTESTDLYQRINLPDRPYKEGYIFEYWCDEKGREYDFSKLVYADMTLYAKYQVDFAYLGNILSTSTIKETVHVQVECYNKSILGAVTSTITSNGSGVIYKREGNNYYLLTNNHVVYTTYEYRKIRIYDYLNREYQAQFITSDANYDLAVIKFSSENELKTTNMALENPAIGKDVCAIGNPKGQRNAITYGKTLDYSIISKTSNTVASNVSFDVIKHSCFINNGSSGGGFYDEKSRLIGIIFAASESKDTGDFLYGYAIPIEKVKEFLNNNNNL